jgi:hypothetical protein
MIVEIDEVAVAVQDRVIIVVSRASRSRHRT